MSGRIAHAVFTALGRLSRLWFRTLRIRAFLWDGTETTPRRYPFGAEIFALCERDAAALGGIAGEAGFTVLVARGRDGDWATAALEAIGCRAVRGATARGGTRALHSLIDAAAASPAPLGVVVDGPLGPDGDAKGGALVCAARTARPIVPLGAAASPRLVLSRAWSRLYVPFPFARVAVVLGEPLRVPASLPRAAREEARAELTRRLRVARDRAEREVAE